MKPQNPIKRRKNNKTQKINKNPRKTSKTKKPAGLDFFKQNPGLLQPWTAGNCGSVERDQYIQLAYRLYAHSKLYKKFELMFTRRMKAYSSSASVV